MEKFTPRKKIYTDAVLGILDKYQECQQTHSIKSNWININLKRSDFKYWLQFWLWLNYCKPTLPEIFEMLSSRFANLFWPTLWALCMSYTHVMIMANDYRWVNSSSISYLMIWQICDETFEKQCSITFKQQVSVDSSKHNLTVVKYKDSHTFIISTGRHTRIKKTVLKTRDNKGVLGLQWNCQEVLQTTRQSVRRHWRRKSGGSRSHPNKTLTEISFFSTFFIYRKFIHVWGDSHWCLKTTSKI